MLVYFVALADSVVFDMAAFDSLQNVHDFAHQDRFWDVTGS